MLWKDREGSSNVEDRRGEGGGFGGGGPRFPMPRGKLGLAVLAVVLVAGYYGIDLTPLLGLDSPMTTPTQSSSYQPSAQEQELAKFSSVALRTTEETHGDEFLRNPVKNTFLRRWFFIQAVLVQPAATVRQRWDLSTVRPIISSTSICLSIKTCRENSEGAGISPWVMS